jgi:nucleoid DNA-binding protein
MSKTELIAMIAEGADLSKEAAEVALNAFHYSMGFSDTQKHVPVVRFDWRGGSRKKGGKIKYPRT